jgi:hypothetical protein
MEIELAIKHGYKVKCYNDVLIHELKNLHCYKCNKKHESIDALNNHVEECEKICNLPDNNEEDNEDNSFDKFFVENTKCADNLSCQDNITRSNNRFNEMNALEPNNVFGNPYDKLDARDKDDLTRSNNLYDEKMNIINKLNACDQDDNTVCESNTRVWTVTTEFNKNLNNKNESFNQHQTRHLESFTNDSNKASIKKNDDKIEPNTDIEFYTKSVSEHLVKLQDTMSNSHNASIKKTTVNAIQASLNEYIKGYIEHITT